jgi:hypothetical protein
VNLCMYNGNLTGVESSLYQAGPSYVGQHVPFPWHFPSYTISMQVPVSSYVARQPGMGVEDVEAARDPWT